MNKQKKQQTQTYIQKLQLCSDELSSLLDLIYKFPQAQRQRYYERIQLLKQNLTQLRMCIKQLQTTSALVVVEKKYHQIYIKINQLKNQIGSSQHNAANTSISGGVGSIHKRKRSQFSISVTENTKQPTAFNSTTPNISKQQQYQEIMETIVSKDQQLKKYKQQLENYQSVVQSYEGRNAELGERVDGLEGKLREAMEGEQRLKQQNIYLHKQNKQLSQSLQQTTTQLTTLKNSHTTQTLQLQHTQSQLQHTLSALSTLKHQSQTHQLQHTALQQQYKHELKQFLEKEQLYKIKERANEKEVLRLGRELEIFREMDLEARNREVVMENCRLREDVKVLEAELAAKEDVLYDKNKKIQAFKLELNTFKANLDKKQEEITRFVDKNKELYCIQNESQNIIELLQSKIKQRQISYGQLQQKKMLLQKQLRQCQQTLQQTHQSHQHQLSTLQLNHINQAQSQQLQYQALQSKLHTTSESLVQANLACQLTEQKLQKMQQENAQLRAQCQSVALEGEKVRVQVAEMARIKGQVDRDKTEIGVRCASFQLMVKQRDELIKALHREIQALKKRLIRAKIQAIRDIRQVIV